MSENPEGMANPQPDEILNRLQAGDRAALQALFHQHHAMVCGTMFRFVKDKSTVEDLAQEVFVRFWEKRESINITSSVQAYLRRMAINEALGYLRRNKHQYDEEITPQTPTGETDSSVEDQYLHSELEQNVRAAIDTLPPKCRTVFHLSRFEDMTYQEIADQMGISIKTVENQMSKALRILREKLKGYLTMLL